MATIDVLLAAYNGARFLPDQLRSLEQQTFEDWRLIVRDDGSSDGSLEVVRAWAARTAREVRFLDDGRQGLGACGNFGALLEASYAPYFAFCDQDDVWLPHKLELMLERVREVEGRVAAERPLLAYSDLEMVDNALRPIAGSFHAFAGIAPPRAGLEVIDLMMQNAVIGCASLGNACLRRSALPIPPEAVMHDWWVALVAAAAGDLIHVPHATVKYRQHGKNASAPIDWAGLAVLREGLRHPSASFRRARAFCSASQQQTHALTSRLGPTSGRSLPALATAYGDLATGSFVKRKLFALRHPPRGGSLLRRLVVGLCL